MQRRGFIGMLGGAASWPITARAQLKAPPLIGYMSGGSASFYAPILPAFRDGLRERGYVEGRPTKSSNNVADLAYSDA